jgi:hypothetical protein
MRRPVALRGVNVVHPRLFLQRALRGQLFDDDRIRRAREIANLPGSQVVQWMGSDREWQIIELKVLRCEPAMLEKRRRDDRRRRNAALFEIG